MKDDTQIYIGVSVCVCEVSYVAPKTPYVELLLLKGRILPGGMAQ